MAKNIRIGGVVKAQRQVELMMAAGDEASLARAQKEASRVMAEVGRICEENDVTVEDLPLPTRKAYAFLLQAATSGSLTLARADAVLQSNHKAPRRPKPAPISHETVHAEAWELGRLMWRRRHDLLRDRDLLAELARRVRSVLTKLEGTGCEHRDFAPPAAALGHWLRFLLQSDHLRLAVKALERAERAAQQVLPRGQTCPEVIWMPPGDEPITIDAGPPRALQVSFEFFNASKKNWKSVFGFYLQDQDSASMDEIQNFLASEACDQYRRLFSPPTPDSSHAEVDHRRDPDDVAPPLDDRFQQKRIERAEENLREARMLPRESWVGGYIRLPSFVQNGATAIRAHQITFASEVVRKIHPGKLGAREELTTEDAILALDDIVQGRSDLAAGRPARLVVNDAHLAARLHSILAGSDTAVEFEERPARIEEIEQFFVEAHRQMVGLPVLPDFMSVKNMTLGDVRAFAEAAYALREAAPWRHICAEDVIELSPSILDMRYLRVLGNGGSEEGLIICDSMKPSHGKGFISVSFEFPEHAPICDVDLFDDEELPVHAGQYPVLLVSRGRGFRRLSPENLDIVVSLMRALASMTPSEFDQGQWRRRIESREGGFDLDFRIPSLLQWRQDQEAARLRDPKQSLGGQHPAMGRLLESGMAADELNDLTAEAGGDLSAEALPTTSEEMAQDLAFEAAQHTGRIQLEIAREALALDASCSEAHMVSARFLSSSSPTEALPHYERAMVCGRARLSASDFEEYRGRLWKHFPARAFLSAKHGLAACLQRLQRFDEAARHFEELLEFTHQDNRGVRYELAATYIDLGNFRALEKLLRNYTEDISCLFDWVQVLARFCQEGDSKAARSALRKARKANRHVEGQLLQRNRFPPMSPVWEPGEATEAEMIVITLRDTWHRIPGASRWLGEQE